MVIGDAADDDYCDDYSSHLDDGVKLRTISNALQVACAVSTQAFVPNERLATMRRYFLDDRQHFHAVIINHHNCHYISVMISLRCMSYSQKGH